MCFFLCFNSRLRCFFLLPFFLLSRQHLPPVSCLGFHGLGHHAVIIRHFNGVCMDVHVLLQQLTVQEELEMLRVWHQKPVLRHGHKPVPNPLPAVRIVMGIKADPRLVKILRGFNGHPDLRHRFLGILSGNVLPRMAALLGKCLLQCLHSFLFPLNVSPCLVHKAIQHRRVGTHHHVPVLPHGIALNRPCPLYIFRGQPPVLAFVYHGIGKHIAHTLNAVCFYDFLRCPLWQAVPVKVFCDGPLNGILTGYPCPPLQLCLRLFQRLLCLFLLVLCVGFLSCRGQVFIFLNEFPDPFLHHVPGQQHFRIGICDVALIQPDAFPVMLLMAAVIPRQCMGAAANAVLLL